MGRESLILPPVAEAAANAFEDTVAGLQATVAQAASVRLAGSIVFNPAEFGGVQNIGSAPKDPARGV